MVDWTTPDAVHDKCGEYITHTAIMSIDDNEITYWRHYATCFHWIIYDMGLSKTIGKVRLFQSSLANAKWGYSSGGVGIGLYVYVSDNLLDFGVPVWEGIMSIYGWNESGEFSKKGRYIKLVSKSDNTYQRLYEFDADVLVPPTGSGMGNSPLVLIMEALVLTGSRIKRRYRKIVSAVTRR